MRGKIAAMMLLAVSATTLAAQGGGRRGQPQGGPPPGGPPNAAGDSGAPPNRAQLEQRLRQRMGQVLKNQLGVNDEQMKKLQEVNRKYDEKRRIVVDQERDVRMSLRDEMLRPDSARGTQVSALMDRMVKAQRQRVDIMEQEQKELSAFLTPMQRARYFGLEEQLRRRMQQMRQQAMNGRAGRGGRAGQQGMPPGQAGMQPGMPGMQGMQGRGGRGRMMPPPDSTGARRPPPSP